MRSRSIDSFNSTHIREWLSMDNREEVGICDINLYSLFNGGTNSIYVISQDGIFAWDGYFLPSKPVSFTLKKLRLYFVNYCYSDVTTFSRTCWESLDKNLLRKSW